MKQELGHQGIGAHSELTGALVWNWGRCCFFALLLYKLGLDMGMLFTIQVLGLDDKGHGPWKLLIGCISDTPYINR